MRVADHAPQPPAADPGGAISQVLPCRQPARGEAEASHRPHGRALLSGPDGLTSGEQLLVSGRSGSAVDAAASATKQQRRVARSGSAPGARLHATARARFGGCCYRGVVVPMHTMRRANPVAVLLVVLRDTLVAVEQHRPNHAKAQGCLPPGSIRSRRSRAATRSVQWVAPARSAGLPNVRALQAPV